MRELWERRGLVRYFGKAFVERRYRRTWLGWLWIPLRPSADIATRVLLFGGFLGVASGNRPYFIFYIFGAAGWRFFSIGVLWATRSVDMYRSVFDRAYLPRATAVVGALFAGAVDALVYAAIGMIGIVYFVLTQGRFYLVITPSLALTLAGLALLAVYVVMVGLWTAPLMYHARDVRFVLNYVLGLVYAATPIAYPISAIPTGFRPIAEYNPVTAPVELVKAGLFGTGPPAQSSLLVSLAFLVITLLLGAVVFTRAEAAAARQI